jgi:hypothetical protein
MSKTFQFSKKLTIHQEYKKLFLLLKILKQVSGRYENKNVNERVCFICHDQIEDEKHVLLYCPLYADLRERLFNEVKRSNRGGSRDLNTTVSKTSLNNL